MHRRPIILILTSLILSLAFPQGYNMQVVGSWRCPTGDLRDPWVGGIEVLGDYVIMAKFYDWVHGGSDTLWIIDVSDKKNPTLAATYVETTLCPRPAIVNNFVTVPDSNLIVVNYFCPHPEDSTIVRVLQLDPSDSNLIIPRGYMKHGRASERLHEFFGGFVFSDDVYYLYSPDSVVRVSSLFVETCQERTRNYYLDGYAHRTGGDIIFIVSDSIYFIGGIIYSTDTTHLEPSPYLAAGRLHLHSPPGYDTLEWLGYWCGYDWDFSYVTAIGYSDSMNLLAALTDHYLVLLQPSTNPSDLGRRYFREIGRYRRWGKEASGYSKMIFDRNYLIFWSFDTTGAGLGAGITALRFDSTGSFEVVGHINGWHSDMVKRGRYLYVYCRWTGNLDIIECLFDTSNVNDGGSYYRHDGEDIDIYPNPVYYGGKVNISSRHNITIYDIRGNVAAKISGGNKAVKLNLTPGVYFAVSNDKGKKTVTKFVVIK